MITGFAVSTTCTRWRKTIRAPEEPISRRVFPEGKDAKGRPYDDLLRWSRFKHFAPAEMYTVVSDHVFPAADVGRDGFDLCARGGWGRGGAVSQLRQAVFPIARFPSVVRNGEDADVCRHLQVDNVIRKSHDRPAANGQVGWQPANLSTGVGRHHDLLDGCIDGIEALDAQGFSPGLVPTAGEPVFGVRLVVERASSPLAKVGFSAAANVVPCQSAGLIREGPSRSSLDFSSPCSLDIGRTLRRCVLEAG